MKRMLLFIMLLTAGTMACKKDTSDTPPVDSFTLIGRWQENKPNVKESAPYPIPPDIYHFKVDGSYFKFYMEDIGEEGTYEIKLTDQPRIFEVHLTRERQSTLSSVLKIEKVSVNEIIITENGTSRKFSLIKT